MTKVKILVFLLLLAGQSSTAQPDYFTYHREIIAAEEMFLNNHVERSLAAYKNTFNHYRPFARDAFIALQLACMIRDTSYATYFFKQCFTVGICWPIILKVEHIRNILSNSVAYKSAIEQLYTEQRKKYFESIDKGLRAHFSRLSKDDDDAKHSVNRYWQAFGKWKTLYPDSFMLRYRNEIENHPIIQKNKVQLKNDPNAEKFYNTVKNLVYKNYTPKSSFDTAYATIIDRNINQLVAISRRIGYVPGEQTIGILDDEESAKSDYLRFVPIVVHLLYHHGCGYWLLKNELLESVKRGEIHPRIYASIYDFSYCNLDDDPLNMSRNNNNMMSSVKCKPTRKDKTYNVFSVADCDRDRLTDIGFVNACRDELSICSVDHDQKKKEYAIQNRLVLAFGIFLGTEL